MRTGQMFGCFPLAKFFLKPVRERIRRSRKQRRRLPPPTGDAHRSRSESDPEAALRSTRSSRGSADLSSTQSRLRRTRSTSRLRSSSSSDESTGRPRSLDLRRESSGLSTRGKASARRGTRDPVSPVRRSSGLERYDLSDGSPDEDAAPEPHQQRASAKAWRTASSGSASSTENELWQRPARPRRREDGMSRRNS